MGEAEAQDWEAVRPGAKCLQECEDFWEKRASWRGPGTTPRASRTGGTPEGISGLALESLWPRLGCGEQRWGLPLPVSPAPRRPSLTSWACHHSPRSWPATACPGRKRRAWSYEHRSYFWGERTSNSAPCSSEVSRVGAAQAPVSAFRPLGSSLRLCLGRVSLSLGTRAGAAHPSPPVESPCCILRSERTDGKVCWMETAGGTQFEESILETCLESWGNRRTALATLSPDCCSNLQAQDSGGHTPSSRQSAHCRPAPQAQSARALSLMSILCCYCSS